MKNCDSNQRSDALLKYQNLSDSVHTYPKTGTGEKDFMIKANLLIIVGLTNVFVLSPRPFYLTPYLIFWREYFLAFTTATC